MDKDVIEDVDVVFEEWWARRAGIWAPGSKELAHDAWKEAWRLAAEAYY